jgi:hypothetical protein
MPLLLELVELPTDPLDAAPDPLPEDDEGDEESDVPPAASTAAPPPSPMSEEEVPHAALASAPMTIQRKAGAKTSHELDEPEEGAGTPEGDEESDRGVCLTALDLVPRVLGAPSTDRTRPFAILSP